MKYNFGPANEGEQIVYGSERPGFDFHSVGARDVSRWISFMREHGIKRVCCLLPKEQLDFYDVDLLEEYRHEFGRRNVCSAGILDCHLCDAETLTDKILPSSGSQTRNANPSSCIVQGVADELDKF